MVDKTITSLLFLSVVPRALWAALETAYVSAAQRHGDVPLMETKEPSPDEIKCMFDFSDRLDDTGPCDISIARLVGLYETFICEVLAADRSIQWHLSALVSVDDSVAVFGLSSPKIPNSVNAFENFAFDYSVWHLASTDQNAAG